jgi:hypothetical protein
VYVEYAQGKKKKSEGPSWLRPDRKSQTIHAMKGTPFMQPAMKKVRPRYRNALKKTIARALLELRNASL